MKTPPIPTEKADMNAKKIDDGGRAFPNHGDGPIWDGMTLRDYFAAQALIGILGSRTGFLIDVGTENAPVWAYRVADAMLVERSKSGGGE